MKSDSPSWMGWFDRPSIPLALPARLLLGYVFILMGLHKIENPFEFLKLIHQYQILPVKPGIWMNMTALVLPWLEVVCGSALLVGIWTRGAALTQVILLTVFTPVVFGQAWNIHVREAKSFFDVAFDCGCGSGVVVIWKKLLENTGLFALAALVTVSRSRLLSLSALFDRLGERTKTCHRCGRELPTGSDELCDGCQTQRAKPSASSAEAVA